MTRELGIASKGPGVTSNSHERRDHGADRTGDQRRGDRHPDKPSSFRFGEHAPCVQQQPQAFLKFEHGPARDVTLTWTTFQDAVEQAGRSRLWGGIHPCYDDLKGRQVGRAAAEAVMKKLGDDPLAGR